MASRDYTSIYNIQDTILNQIAPNYFEVDKISLMNTGLYGLITGTMSTVAEDTMTTTSRYITEMIPGQSKLPSFIYANAANYGITDIFAKCAQCTAMLFIKESDVLKHGTVSGRHSFYTIDSDLLVYVEDVPFSIPSNIKIRSTYYNGKYNHHCYYDNNMTNDAVEMGDVPYIRSAKTKITGGNDTYLALSVVLYQYTRKKTTESIIMNNALNIAYIDVPFDDKLCNIEIIYREGDSANYTQLKKLVKNSAPISKPFVYYELLDEQTLRLFFSNDDRYFLPSYNSELDIYTYETLGSKGNFTQYLGEDVYVSASSEVPELEYNNEVSMYCNVTGDSHKGRDNYTLEETLAMTSERQITVDSITTDNDLDQYFKNNYTPEYNTFAKSIKIRDDVACRIYSTYTRLKDDDKTYPTNTVNLEIPLDDSYVTTTDDKIILKSGTRIGYKNATTLDDCITLNTPTYEVQYKGDVLRPSSYNLNLDIENKLVKITLLDDDIVPDTPTVDDSSTGDVEEFIENSTETTDETSVTESDTTGNVYSDSDFILTINFDGQSMTFVPIEIDTDNNVLFDISGIDESIINDKRDIEYSTIGLLVVDKNPTSAAFYMNSIDKTITLDYTYVNEDSLHQFIVKSLRIERNAALNEDSYLISALIIPTDLSIVDDAIESDFYSGDIDESEETTTEDVFNISKIALYLFLDTASGHYIKLDYDADESGSDNGYVFQCEIGTSDLMSGDSIELSGMVSCGTQVEEDCFTNMQHPPFKLLAFYNEPENTQVHDYAELIPDATDMTLCNVYTPQEDSMYLAYPLNLVHPVVEFLPDSTDAGYKINVLGVPVVGRDFILQDGNLAKLLARVNSQHEFLNDTKITSNFSIHMKFFNTYGRSRIFTVTNGDLLNHVNTDIKLTIAFNSGVEPMEYINDIKITVRDYIEGINNVGNSGVNSVKMSSLITLLSNTYPNEIDYIIFNSINGYSTDVQTITMELDLSESANINRIPEFLTLSVDDIEITTK